MENEITIAKISNKDKILHVGCGPIPATSIFIVKKTNADVTSIDKNLQSIKLEKGETKIEKKTRR